MSQYETIEQDILIVGAGPAGLATACRLKQMALARQQDLRVCVIEKSEHIGGHILSGAIMRADCLDELFPDWSSLDSPAPLEVQVEQDEFHILLNRNRSIRVPHFLLPRALNNRGNFVGSLSRLCRWLAKQAEELGVDLITGYAAQKIIYDEQGKVSGVITDAKGLDKQGARKSTYQAAFELQATYTVFAEGCRGHLGKELIKRFRLSKPTSPQHYALGIKEIWQLEESRKAGRIIHSIGWPLGFGRTTGGGFLYQLSDKEVAVGLITDLNYENPWLNPYQEFQAFKHHPLIREVLGKGRRIAYGAKTLVKGGLESLPELSFPGGLLVGDNAGFLNSLQLKGVHTAIQSGILAAEALLQAFDEKQPPAKPSVFQSVFENSRLYRELQQSRNASAALHKFGTLGGSAFVFLEHKLFRSRLPFTLKDRSEDHSKLISVDKFSPIAYPPPDNKFSFDISSSLHLANISHDENQPPHLLLADPETPLQFNLPQFDEPAQRYCPAGVYEVIQDSRGKRFQINAQNCLHCKCCDIKDPCQNITWTAPEGGSGPNYTNM